MTPTLVFAPQEKSRRLLTVKHITGGDPVQTLARAGIILLTAPGQDQRVTGI